mmetsp:Transcript_22364/g.68100  ORF Transcript_22364/g.68100 Transcript_22364/m.68100 type:complete len:228 (+) Transcript_22364:1957-2640(+)
MVFCVPFSSVVCSLTVAITASSNLRVALFTFCNCPSRMVTSLCIADCVVPMRISSASVCSRDLEIICSRSSAVARLWRDASIAASTPRISTSSLLAVVVSASFFCSSALMALRSPISSVSMANSCSRCLRIASSTLWSASFLRSIPITAVFHCAISCFFSNRMASISAAASCSSCSAPPVSLRCAMSCASVSANCSCSRFSRSLSESMSKSWLFLFTSSFAMASSAL